MAQASEQRSVRGRLDSYFKISERGSTMSRELRGGLVTFVAMAYIVVLNPLILGSFSADDPGAKLDSTGAILPVPQVAAVTALVAGVMTILMGIIANYPFAMAAGLGINALVAVTIAPQMTWASAMGLVMVNGLVVMVLVVTGVRSMVFRAVPAALKVGIAVGIGLFIALIGLADAGFVTAGSGTLVQLGIDGSIASWPTGVFAVTLLVMAILVARNIRGAILLGVLFGTVLSIVVEAIVDAGPSGGTNPKGWSLGYPGLPDNVFGIPDLSLIGQVDFGAWAQIPAITAALLVFSLVLTDFFDTIGTMTGLGREANLADKAGNLPNVGKTLFIDSLGAVAGGAASSSSNTVFVESAAGIAEGARTGLANVVTGLLFIAAMFFTPLYEVVPIEAAAPALVVVGALMIRQITDIDFRDFAVALPAFLTIVVMPFTYSIANGIGVGFVSYVVLRAATGKAREVHPLMWVTSAFFVIYFAIGPIQAALA
ncbi:MFS transporter [Prauserella marina]|uniref:Putative MFS transporter, AGZA family, xanthine/uracil permease n=1 Tax=Prauserella marina TaxID=530584 RepID=A0A222VWD2_9PSEU|nr:NCS2 family permease [Prauserella marina]ASR38200.1 MFS transporter [Prauserella marina]PWV78617.1 AGZA family xanthine/uracil permease-like MFS transporter [Prauserella marina]SDC90069.1 putative MFS transporter, AGZA family, xanthine/uracil permease [Prauserella marina]